MTKKILWSSYKNELLKKNRSISFEDIVEAISSDSLIDVLSNHSKSYPNQRAFVVKVFGYVYYVPFVENDDEIFLKMIIPSRKLNKKYEKK